MKLVNNQSFVIWRDLTDMFSWGRVPHIVHHTLPLIRLTRRNPQDLRGNIGILLNHWGDSIEKFKRF